MRYHINSRMHFDPRATMTGGLCSFLMINESQALQITRINKRSPFYDSDLIAFNCTAFLAPFQNLLL